MTLRLFPTERPRPQRATAAEEHPSGGLQELRLAG